ncbi:MAG: winged helix-turn-helix domain-containing protein [Bryobacteraceae bacterium]
MGQRIAMIEDEPDLLEMVGYGFRKDGFEFQGFTRGSEGIAYLRRNPVDLLLLDILLPDENGLEICRLLREDSRLAALPIVFVTAKGEEFDRILGLELGADDYVVKPFSPRELLARVKAVLRRKTRQAEPGEVIEAGELRMDARTQDVIVRGQPASLSALEFRLLFFLAAHPRRIFSRERLLDEVWGGDRYVTPRTIDVHVRRLREKIEARPDAPEYIGTVRGAGYRFVGQPNESQ